MDSAPGVSRSCGRAWLALFVWAATAANAAPDAGSLLQSVKPAARQRQSGDAGVIPDVPALPAQADDSRLVIPVKAIRIRGAQVFTADELLGLAGDLVGRDATLSELSALAGRITARYRSAGYLLARAYLPAQDVYGGVIEIVVLEGRIGKRQIDNQAGLAEADVTARLADVDEQQVLNGPALERALLLINDLPGVEVRSTLKPGASVGTTELDIRLGAKSATAGSLELDNYGNRSTGELRAGADVQLGNLSGHFDAMSLRALASSGMAYGRGAWQLPVGSLGTQLGMAGSVMHYRLGQDFASLGAHGQAGIASVYVLHPFVRSRTANVNAQLAHDHKTLSDDVDSTEVHTRKRIDLWTLGLSGDLSDGAFGGGLSTWSFATTAGQLGLDDASLALDAAGHRSAGSFGRANLMASRQQSLAALSDSLTLVVNLQAQWARKNLDSAEKMSLGGAQGVRAHPQGEAPSDDAWLLTLELRWALAADWQASVFGDTAEGHLNHQPLAADGGNRRRISGAGLGLNCIADGTLSLQSGLAWRLGARPTSDVDRSPRLWVQALKRF